MHHGFLRRTGALLALFTSALPALAHHPMGGQTPTTFMQGLLSGFGHPIIGPDHLAFILAAGLIAWRFAGSGRWLLPLAFVAATAAGSGVHLLAVSLPLAELTVAGSVLLLGLLLVLDARLPAAALALLFAAAGVFHGYAYGETVVGAETTPIAAYLFGFTVIQTALAYAALLAARRWLHRPGLRLGSGLVIAAVGLLFVALNLT